MISRADAAIAIEEWMDCFELQMERGGLEQDRLVSAGREGRVQLPIHSWTQSGGGRTKAALPGRVPPIQFWLVRIARSLAAAPACYQQDAMNLADQSE